MSEVAKFKSWAVLELMGHVRMAGWVTEEIQFGKPMVRIDVPPTTEGANDGFTRFFGPKSIYSLSPVGEEAAKAVAKRNRGEPVSPWEYPQSGLQALADRSERTDDYDNESIFDHNDDEEDPDNESTNDLGKGLVEIGQPVDGESSGSRLRI